MSFRCVVTAYTFRGVTSGSCGVSPTDRIFYICRPQSPCGPRSREWLTSSQGHTKKNLHPPTPPKPPRRPLSSPHLKWVLCSVLGRLYFAATSGVCLIRSGAAGFQKKLHSQKNVYTHQTTLRYPLATGPHSTQNTPTRTRDLSVSAIKYTRTPTKTQTTRGTAHA